MLTDLGIEVQVACGIITLICFRWLRKEDGRDGRDGEDSEETD